MGNVRLLGRTETNVDNTGVGMYDVYLVFSDESGQLACSNMVDGYFGYHSGKEQQAFL
jgi:hypothetical protein